MGTAEQPHEGGMGRERRKTPALPAGSQLIFKRFIQSWDLLSRELWKKTQRCFNSEPPELPKQVLHAQRLVPSSAPLPWHSNAFLLFKLFSY